MRMQRAEFSREVRRQALKRSGGFCEASGPAYGFARGTRCRAPLFYGVEFDHYPIRAADGGDGSIDNCMAVCRKCHRWKTAKVDIPALAKGRRIRDRLANLRPKQSSFQTNRDRPFKRSIDGRTRLR